MIVTLAPASGGATFALSFHATYGCRNSGVCCTSGWPIAIEADRLAVAERALVEGRLRLARGAAAFMRVADAPSDTPALVGTADGACVFHRGTGIAGCGMQHALGHDALPLACRQFPRVSVIDARGASITLSHYCPTAASLLSADTAAITIAGNAPAFPPGGHYVGLDVRQSLPPLLRPDMLMDWDAWWRWEREAVALIAECREPGEAIARLAAAVEHVRPWTPADGPLMRAIGAAFDTARGWRLDGGTEPDTRAGAGVDAGAGAASRADVDRRSGPRGGRPAAARDEVAARVREVLDAVPAEMRAEAAAAAARTSTGTGTSAHLRFLAAHAFANWTAHQGRGLRSWLRSIEAAHALVVSGLGVGDADLLLRHLCDQDALARTWSRAERAA